MASCMVGEALVFSFLPDIIDVFPTYLFLVLSVPCCLYLMHKQLHSVIPIDDLLMLLLSTLCVLLVNFYMFVGW
jgi:hypothetical protein